MWNFLCVFLFIALSRPVYCKLCDPSNFEMVGRVVFGEAREEPMDAKLGVAYTILNRIQHEAYPNSLYSVIFERMTNGDFQFQTLNNANHTREWQNAKITKDPMYSDVFQATMNALCRWETDPTECATNFCPTDPCEATESNPWWSAVNKKQFGNIFFVCRVSATASNRSRRRW